MTLPEAVVAQSRHSWSDAAVLDATNKPMQFAVYDASPSTIGDVQTTRLTCAPTNDAAEGSSRFHCSAPQPIENAYGVRVHTWPFTHIDVDLPPNEHLEFKRDTPEVPFGADAPFFFSNARRVDVLDVTVDGRPYRGVDVTVATLPSAEPQNRNWRKARFLWSEQDNKRFVYATDFPARLFSARLGLDRPPNATDHFAIEGCSDAPCKSAYNANKLSLDALLLGRNPMSNPMPVGPFGSDLPFVHVDSTSPLNTPPSLELESSAPTLVFRAFDGVRPFTLAVGLKNFDGTARLGLSRQIEMPFGISQAEAGLSEPSQRSQLIARLLNGAGPLSLFVVLLIGMLWVVWPSFSVRAQHK